MILELLRAAPLLKSTQKWEAVAALPPLPKTQIVELALIAESIAWMAFDILIASTDSRTCDTSSA
jgi:hypothetical protein